MASLRTLFWWATAASIVLLVVPFGRLILLPLVYLNTHLHELCHALAAIGTGGRAEHILVFSSGAGVTPIQGGILPIVAAAGYVGSTVLGAVMIAAARTEQGAKHAFGWTAGVLAASMLMFVRGDLVGVLTGVFWCLVCWALAKRAKGEALRFAAQFIGIQQCLAAFQSLLVLLNLSVATEAQSDAKIMEQATGIPALAWAGGWAVLSAFLVTATLRRAWR